MLSKNRNAILSSVLFAVGLTASCATPPSSSSMAGDGGTTALALALEKGSICPFPGGLTGLMWWIQATGGHLVGVPVTASDVEAYCSGAKSALKRIHVEPGEYEVIMQARDGSGRTINDVDLSYDAVSIAAGATPTITKTYRAATQPVNSGDDPVDATMQGNETMGDDDFVCGQAPAAPRGCCCPSTCKGESYVGCNRAVRNGICTGWTNPCGC